MQIIVNGEPQQVESGITVGQLLEQLAYTGKRLAVEVNMEIVPRSAHADHALVEGDRVEIVHAIGGGAQGIDTPTATI